MLSGIDPWGRPLGENFSSFSKVVQGTSCAGEWSAMQQREPADGNRGLASCNPEEAQKPRKRAPEAGLSKFMQGAHKQV